MSDKAIDRQWLPLTLACAVIVLVRTVAIFSASPFISTEAGANGQRVALSAAMAYSVAQAAMQLPWGLVARRFPPGRVLVAGLLVFAGGLMLQAASSSWLELVIARLIQGAAAVTGVAVALLVQSSPRALWKACYFFCGLGPGISMLGSAALRGTLPPDWGLPEVSVCWALVCLSLCPLLATPAVPSAVERDGHHDTPRKRDLLAVALWNAAGVIALTHALATSPAWGPWVAATVPFAAAWRAFVRAAAFGNTFPDPGRISAITLAQALGVAVGCAVYAALFS